MAFKKSKRVKSNKQSRLESIGLVWYFRNLPGYISLAFFVLMIAVLSSVSSLLQVQQVGEIAIGVYFVLALIFKIDSRTTFKLALITLLAVAGLSAVDPENEMTDTLAVYTYLLLVVGVVTAIVESIRDGRNHGHEAVESVKAGAQFVRRGLRRDQVRPVKLMALMALGRSPLVERHAHTQRRRTAEEMMGPTIPRHPQLGPKPHGLARQSKTATQHIAPTKRADAKTSIKNDHVYPQARSGATSVKNTKSRPKLIQL